MWVPCQVKELDFTHGIPTGREKLLRFHGERYAQLDCDKSIFEEDPARCRRSRLFSAISWIFFFTPHIYYERLSHTWVDNKINYDHWGNFVSWDLPRDWEASITPVGRLIEKHGSWY